MFQSSQRYHSHHLLCSFSKLSDWLTAVPECSFRRNTLTPSVSGEPASPLSTMVTEIPSGVFSLPQMHVEAELLMFSLGQYYSCFVHETIAFFNSLPWGVPNSFVCLAWSGCSHRETGPHFHFHSTWILTRELRDKPIFENNRESISFKVNLRSRFWCSVCSWFLKRNVHKQGYLLHRQPALQNRDPQLCFSCTKEKGDDTMISQKCEVLLTSGLSLPSASQPAFS